MQVIDAGARRAALHPVFLSAASGTLLGLAFPYTSLWPLAWVALVPLFVALRGRSWAGGGGLGFVFGLFLYGITLRWAAELDPHAGWVLWGLFVFIESLVPALLGIVVALLSRGPVADPLRPLAITASYTLMEWLRTKGAYSLTWSEISYSQLPSGFIVQMADITGGLGVGFMVALANASLAELWCWRRDSPGISPPPPLRRALLLHAAFIGACLVYGAARLATLPAPSGEGVVVACVQPNVDPREKWDPARFNRVIQTLDEATGRAAAQGARLVVWPETAIPRAVLEDAVMLPWVQGLARNHHVNILVGSTDHSPQGQPQNTAFLMTDQGQVDGRYAKTHLVPFGEYLPLRSVFEKIPPFDTIGDLVPGDRPFVFKTPSLRFGTLICFESTFPDLCREMVAGGAQALVVITNDGWFNHTSAAEHHLAMSSMRAIEQRMWVVQCGNTGISAFIDARGVARGKTDLFVKAETLGTISPSDGNTLYQRSGNAFAYLVALAWLICSVRAARMRR